MPRHRQRAATAALFLLAVSFLAGCDKIKSKQEIKKGNEFLKAAQYQSALAAYEEALRLDPGETKLHKHIGIAYMGMYQPGSKHPKDLEYAQKAIENLKQYVQAYPEDNKSLEYLVSMYLNTERYDDAIAFYQNEFLKRNPKDGKAMNSLAMLYFKKGDFDNGVLWLKKRLEVEGNNPEVYYLIGVQAWDRSYNYPDINPELRAQDRRGRAPVPQQGRRAQARLLRGGLVHQPALPGKGQDGDGPRQEAGADGHGEQVSPAGPRDEEGRTGKGQGRGRPGDSGTGEVGPVSYRVGGNFHV